MTLTNLNERQGIVVKKNLGKYTIRPADGSPIVCELIGNLRKQLMFSIADPSSLRVPCITAAPRRSKLMSSLDVETSIAPPATPLGASHAPAPATNQTLRSALFTILRI